MEHERLKTGFKKNLNNHVRVPLKTEWPEDSRSKAINYMQSLALLKKVNILHFSQAFTCYLLLSSQSVVKETIYLWIYVTKISLIKNIPNPIFILFKLFSFPSYLNTTKSVTNHLLLSTSMDYSMQEPYLIASNIRSPRTSRSFLASFKFLLSSSTEILSSQ